MITGSFSLVGIQDAILVESCYKATQQNIAPSAPTSNNEDGSIPEGWSGTLISVSASMPYVWESQRTKDGSWSAWSTPILKNSWGKQGAKLRMRTWTENVVYLQGADGEEFYDVVVYNNKLYLCTKTHTSGSGNNPSASISGYLGYWESAQDWTFVATRLLLAEKIKASQIDVDSLKVKHLDGADGTFTGQLVAASGSFTGSLLTNSEGKRILINPDTRSIQLILKDNSIISEWAFFENNGYQSCTLKLFNNGAENLIMYPHLVRLIRGNDVKLDAEPGSITLQNGNNKISIRANQITMSDGNNYTGHTGSTTFYDSNGNGTRMYFYCGILYKIVSV